MITEIHTLSILIGFLLWFLVGFLGASIFWRKGITAEKMVGGVGFVVWIFLKVGQSVGMPVEVGMSLDIFGFACASMMIGSNLWELAKFWTNAKR